MYINMSTFDTDFWIGDLAMPKNVTIQKIISILLEKIKFIIFSTFIVGLLFCLYSNFIITPIYSTSSMIFVQNYNSKKNANNNTTDDKSDSKSINEENQKIYGSDISGSSTLANICVILFQNSDKMTAVYDGCSVTMQVTEGTFYITFTVTGPDPQKCTNVANKLTDVAQEVFKEQFAYGHLGTVRDAKVPYAPISPDNTKNTILGLALGLIASCVIFILLELIDTTIKADDDLQQIYGLPVFAEIPDFETQSR